MGGWPYFLSWRSAQTTPPSTAPPCTGQPWPCPVLSLPRLLVSAWPWPLPGFFQDVLVDGLARLRVAAGGVPALPATVLALAEVSLPLALRFAMAYYLLCSNTTYRRKEEKSLGQQRRVNKNVSDFAFLFVTTYHFPSSAKDPIFVFMLAQDFVPSVEKCQPKRPHSGGQKGWNQLVTLPLLNTTDHLKLRTPPSRPP